MVPILLAALLALPSPLPFGSLPDQVVPGIVWIRSADGIGTGWIVDRQRKRIVTCLHIVGDAKTVEVFFADRHEGRYRTQRSWYVENQADLAKRGRLVRGKVVARAEDCDLALVEVETLPDDAIELPLARPVRGRQVFSLGHRQDSDSLWLPAFGIVRQIGRLADGYFWNGRKLAGDCPAAFVSSPILPGDSGGPVVDAGGRVVGILSAVRWNAPQVSVAIDVSQLAKLGLKPAIAPEAQPPTDRLAEATVRIVVSGSSARHAGVILDSSPTMVLTCAAAGGNSREVDVLLPLRDALGRIVAEDDRYSDPIALRQSGRLVRGLVLIRDPARDMTLIELPGLPTGARGMKLSRREAKAGEAVSSMNHPSGVEVGWLHSQGIVRTSAPVRLNPEEVKGERRPQAYLVQMPTSAGSAGGGLMLADGTLGGLVSSREAAQQQIAFAVTSGEISDLFAEAKALFAPVDADGFRTRTETLRERGRLLLAVEVCLKGLNRYPNDERLGELLVGIIAGRDAPGDALVREGARLEALGKSEDALMSYGKAIERYPSLPDALRCRAELYGRLKEGKRAAIDAAALVELRPLDASARLGLARAWLVRGDEDKAILALVDAHRLGACGRARGLLAEYAERLRTDWPDSPDRPANWVRNFSEKVKPYLSPEGIPR